MYRYRQKHVILKPISTCPEEHFERTHFFNFEFEAARIGRRVEKEVQQKTTSITKHSNNNDNYKNIGAKVLSARLAKVINLLTTMLTTCLCNAKEHVAKSGEIRPETTVR